MDNTNFSEVFDLFLSQIDDYELAAVDSAELDEVLSRYLNNSLTELLELDVELDAIDFQLGEFGTKLSTVEKNIFAKAMKLEWIREKRASSELMEKSIGDRDFASVQGYTYLKEIGVAEKDLAKSIRQYQIDYSYKDFEGF